MSQWTHVAGIIRTDSFGRIDQDKLQAIMGFTCQYESNPELWEETKMDATPCGSEGSLQWKYDSGDSSDHSMSQGWIVIWGDLRDFGSAAEIITWLEDKRAKLFLANIWIRQMAINIEVEGFATQIVTETEDGLVVTNIPSSE